MPSSHRHLSGAFAAMLFVGVSWGANLPVTKVMLLQFDLIPLAAIRTLAAVAVLAVLLAMAEGRAGLRIGLPPGRFLALGLMMSSFFAFYALGLRYSNPITAATVQVAGPLISAATVWLVTGLKFDAGFGVALALTVVGGLILSSSNFFGAGHLTFEGGEVVVLMTNGLWTLYSIKTQAWFDRESQLHRAYVASVSAAGWLVAGSIVLVELGQSRSPFAVTDSWAWTQLIFVAAMASGVGSFTWNIGASRLGIPVASLWVNLVPFFAVLWSMVYGFRPNAFQIVGGLVALGGVVYMQARKIASSRTV